MDTERIKQLLEAVKSGRTGVEEAMEQLKSLPYQDLGFVKLDTHRSLRKGFPEVVFCPGKSPEQIKEILLNLTAVNPVVLAMRATEQVYQHLRQVPEMADKVEYYPQARAILVGKKPEPQTQGVVLVLTGGTADIPVAEEAAVTAEAMGSKVERLYDVGVAGLHRLLYNRDRLLAANVLVVVAGMEGALPSVVGGLVDKPVIAVPTSVGYGASLHGLSALLAMLNSCAPGLAVVNIDNGFGAGYLASLINQMTKEKQ